MTGGFYLAWRYLVHHRVKSTILVLAIAVILFLPAGLNVLVGQSAANLTARAGATPLLVGAKGSPLGLVLRALYFESSPPESTSWVSTGVNEPLHRRSAVSRRRPAIRSPRSTVARKTLIRPRGRRATQRLVSSRSSSFCTVA